MIDRNKNTLGITSMKSLLTCTDSRDSSYNVHNSEGTTLSCYSGRRDYLEEINISLFGIFTLSNNMFSLKAQYCR